MASKLGPLAVIVGHELRSRLRDGTALLVAFVAPVVLATLFGVALAGTIPFVGLVLEHRMATAEKAATATTAAAAQPGQGVPATEA